MHAYQNQLIPHTGNLFFFFLTALFLPGLEAGAAVLLLRAPAAGAASGPDPAGLPEHPGAPAAPG